jgi:hypothetical protein
VLFDEGPGRGVIEFVATFENDMLKAVGQVELVEEDGRARCDGLSLFAVRCVIAAASLNLVSPWANQCDQNSVMRFMNRKSLGTDSSSCS